MTEIYEKIDQMMTPFWYGLIRKHEITEGERINDKSTKTDKV